MAKPRTSRTVSAEPREPATVENRTNTGVRVPGRGQEFRRGVLGQRIVVRFEVAVGAGTAGVHHPFRDALVVEVGDLLAGVEILQQRRAAFADRQRVVGVVDPNALLRGQVSGVAVDPVLLELFLLCI